MSKTGAPAFATRRRCSLVTIRLLFCAIAAVPASGCSLNFPMAGFAPDPTVTGSIDKSDALLFKALDQEDWRRAKAAMAVALDPQGNGKSVTWENPASGAHGMFVAAAAPTAQADAICRDFRAHVIPDAANARDVAGSACRDAAGDWIIRNADLVETTHG